MSFQFATLIDYFCLANQSSAYSRNQPRDRMRGWKAARQKVKYEKKRGGGDREKGRKFNHQRKVKIEKPNGKDTVHTRRRAKVEKKKELCTGEKGRLDHT